MLETDKMALDELKKHTPEELTQADFEKNQDNDKFINEVKRAHSCFDSNKKYKHELALTHYIIGYDAIVSEAQIKQSRAIYN